MMNMFSSFNSSNNSNNSNIKSSPDDYSYDNPYREHVLLPGMTLNTYAPCRATFIALPNDGGASIRELQQQRLRWKAFLASHPNAFRPSDAWIWLNRAQPIGDPGAGPILKRVQRLFNPRMQIRKRVKELVRTGIPPELRGSVWIACSGSIELKNKTKKEFQYYNLLKRINNLTNQIKADIEKDLLRTFPDLLNDTAIINKLRNVLSAYALRNDKIGYCQSMNYLCAMILLHINDEEDAFWCFAALIELIIPKNYYEPSLLGGKVDQSVFRTCVASKLPKVNAVFESTNTILEPIICPWFLCLYLNILPLHAACRIWDCMFWEGSMVLFRTGLAMIKMKSSMLLNCTDFISVYSVLKINTKKSYNFEISRTFPNSTSNIPSSPTSLHSSSTLGWDENEECETDIEISDAEYLIQNIFGYRWLRSVPAEKIESLRRTFYETYTEKSKSKSQKDSSDTDFSDDDDYDDDDESRNKEEEDIYDAKNLTNSSFSQTYVAPYRSENRDDKTIYINNPISLTNSLSPRMKRKLNLKSSVRESEANLLSRIIYSDSMEEMVKLSNEMKNNKKNDSINNQIKELARHFDAKIEEGDETLDEELENEDFSSKDEEENISD